MTKQQIEQQLEKLNLELELALINTRIIGNKIVKFEKLLNQTTCTENTDQTKPR